MALVEFLVLGAALAMDAFAVTVSNTLAYPGASRARLLAMPVLFGLFQGGLALCGSLLGTLLGDVIERFSGPVALVVLGVIGANMVREGVAGDDGGARDDDGCGLTVPKLLLEAVATAIDAFAVGVSLRAMGAPAGEASLVIGLTTLALCLVALAVGRWAGPRLGARAQVAGGIVLVAIGVKACFF